MGDYWTTEEIRKLLITLLCGVAGADESRWASVIGEVKHVPIANNVHCNWMVVPKGTARERAAISKAVEIVRAEHPYIAAA